MKKDAILILSGGIDSVTMLYEYKESIALAVSFDMVQTIIQKNCQWLAFTAKNLEYHIL